MNSNGFLKVIKFPFRLVSRIHPHDIGLQQRLALWPAVEHVAARITLHLHAVGFPHYRHLIDDQDRSMKGHDRSSQPCTISTCILGSIATDLPSSLAEPRSRPLSSFSWSGESVHSLPLS